MSLKEVLAPAIKLAEEGYPVSYDFSRSLQYMQRMFQRWPSTLAIFYDKNGEALQYGDIFIQKDLAKTLKLIAEKGSDGFYRGEVAEKIAAAIQKAGGIMTTQDLANYKAVLRKPVSGTYRGYEIHSMPPPSSGGVHLIEMLNILENSNITEMGANSAASIHQMVEAMKYAYADRSEYLGDPDFFKVPIKTITSKAYAHDIFKKIDPLKATPSNNIKPGNLVPYESDQTTHYSVTDKWGNAVSTTTTLNFSYGSGMVAEGTGVIMNNEMDDFSAKPGSPNGYGLIGGAANKIEKGKRPLSSMTPTIVLKDGIPFLITGSPGGSRIITTTLQLIMNVIDHNMNVAEASAAKRIHHQWFPDEIRIEKGINIDTLNLLKSKGHSIKMQRAMGSTQSILITPDWIFGASDPRSLDGKAAGY
jgi:gamma-glutamyltranspeptidase/glutathione hydrolase